MPEYQYLELLNRGPVSRVRLLNHGPGGDEEVAALTSELNSVAGGADCQTLFVDCSNYRLLSSEVLGKLIVLRRRLKKKVAMVLCGLRPEVRGIIQWIKLDRLF